MNTSDYKIGDGADDDEDGSGVAIDEDTFVDATHERRRVQAAVVRNLLFFVINTFLQSKSHIIYNNKNNSC